MTQSSNIYIQTQPKHWELVEGANNDDIHFKLDEYLRSFSTKSDSYRDKVQISRLVDLSKNLLDKDFIIEIHIKVPIYLLSKEKRLHAGNRSLEIDILTDIFDSMKEETKKKADKYKVTKEINYKESIKDDRLTVYTVAQLAGEIYADYYMETDIFPIVGVHGREENSKKTKSINHIKSKDAEIIIKRVQQ